MATPRQGTEELAHWAAFRLELLRADVAATVRQDAAATGVKFRGGTGSCVIDDYITRIGTHHYQEIACLVQGQTSASVIVAADPAPSKSGRPSPWSCASSVTGLRGASRARVRRPARTRGGLDALGAAGHHQGVRPIDIVAVQCATGSPAARRPRCVNPIPPTAIATSPQNRSSRRRQRIPAGGAKP
jgi:hypothetical protein